MVITLITERVILHKRLVSPLNFILSEGWSPQNISRIQPYVGIPERDAMDCREIQRIFVLTAPSISHPF